MIKKLGAVIFTLLLIGCAVYGYLRLGNSNKASAPDNMIIDGGNTEAVVQSIPEDAVTSIAITKAPGNETVIINGVTWFIAHADNADTLEWVFMKPTNVEFSPKEMEEEFPGLKVTLLSDDTVEVKNIPESMNGWRIKARFGNEDGFVDTDTATISVVDYDLMYIDVIRKYKDFCSGSNTYAEEVSPLALIDRKLGYTLVDINGDGRDELIIGSVDPTSSVYSGGIYDMYTIRHDEKKGDKLMRVIIGSEAERFYLRNDNRFYSISSPSIGVSDYRIYDLGGREIYVVESAWTNLSADEPDAYYFTVGGDRDSEEYEYQEKIGEGDFYSKVGEYDASVVRIYPEKAF